MIEAKDIVNAFARPVYGVELKDLRTEQATEGYICTACFWSRTRENPMSGIIERVLETWMMVEPEIRRTYQKST